MNEVSENSKTKSSQLRMLVIVATVVMIVLGIFVWMLSRNTQDSTQVVEKLKFSDALKHADPESTILEKVQKGLEDTKKQTNDLKKQVNDEINRNGSLNNNKQKELEDRLALLEKKISSNQIDPSSSSQVLSGGDRYQGRMLVQPGYQNTMNAPIDDGIREDRLTVTSNDFSKRRPFKNPDTYVPAGTFVQAVMLSGADASAAVTSPHNPNPMIFRIISDGTLPNHRKSHLKGCTVTAYVAGDISSERGEINLEKISCVFPNNEIIDPKIEGWVFGRDGKFGVRGNPVWREGKLLQRAFAAGALSGLSDGLSQTYTTNSISAEGNVQTVNPGKIFPYGAAKGAGKAMDKLADYNIQRAEQYHPVIQISPGDVVDVVFRFGFYLDGKQHDHDDESKPIPNMFDSNASVPMTQAGFLSPDERTLPLSAEQVRKIQENSKQLGFRVTGGSNS